LWNYTRPVRLIMWGSRKEQLTLTFKIAFVVEEDEGGFHAFAPALKGLHVDGNTKEEAERNLIAGIQVHIESLARHGDSLPIGPDFMVHEELQIPQGAFLGSLTLQWPSLQTSGIS
jgi:predicted RNase H-like HicB family nuclease